MEKPRDSYTSDYGNYYGGRRFDDVEFSEKPRAEEEEIEDSPIPEVSACVPNTDDPTIPCNTFRVWLLGILWTIVGTAINTFMSNHWPPLFVSSLMTQILVYPMGKFLAKILPTTKFTIFGSQCSFNPGPFNIKEHVLIVVMANVAYGTAYAFNIIQIQRLYYQQTWGFAYELLLVLSTQVLGYGLAGSMRKYLIYPASMWWPSNLVSVVLYQTFHKEEVPIPGQWSRYRVFCLVILGAFTFYWVPDLFITVLSTFSWICFAKPDNWLLSQITGANAMGIGALTFDWGQINLLGSPLMNPWWVIVNTFVGFAATVWVIAPIGYFTNIWRAQYFPFNSEHSFTATGAKYDVREILNPDNTFNSTLYENYGDLYLSYLFAFVYGVSFAGLTCVLTHIFLWHRREIIENWARSRNEGADIHAKLMAAYPECPNWWYYLILIITTAISIFTMQYWDTHLPWWGVLFAIALAFVFLLPIGIITAISNQTPGLNVITEMIVGYMLPGRPIANVCFKTYGYITMGQAIGFLSDLKLGHYMKIPPRMMFTCQMVATILACFVQVIVMDWSFEHIPDFCQDNQPQGFTCRGVETFFTASIIWGVIGPNKMFGPGAKYNSLLWGFAIGAVAPIPFYLLAKKFPKSNIWKNINIPVMLAGLGAIPPALSINFTSWLIVGFIFQFYIRRYHFSWWVRYNYLVSAALDSGVAFAGFVIFFVANYSPWDTTSIFTTFPGNNLACSDSSPMIITSDTNPEFYPVGFIPTNTTYPWQINVLNYNGQS